MIGLLFNSSGLLIHHGVLDTHLDVIIHHIQEVRYGKDRRYH